MTNKALKVYHCEICKSTELHYKLETRYYWVVKTQTYKDEEYHIGWYCHTCDTSDITVYSVFKEKENENGESTS